MVRSCVLGCDDNLLSATGAIVAERRQAVSFLHRRPQRRASDAPIRLVDSQMEDSWANRLIAFLIAIATRKSTRAAVSMQPCSAMSTREKGNPGRTAI